MRHSRIAWLAAAFSVSCGHAARPRAPEFPPPSLTVKIWVKDSTELSKADVLAGCGVWRIKGVACELVADPVDADVWVSIDTSDCVEDEKHMVTLARAFRGGRIEMHMACFAEKDDKDRVRELRAVVGHEIGHELGIWDHVPLDCDGKRESGKPILQHPSGKPVCGTAMMNPSYRAGVDDPTLPDRMAFDLRERGIAVVLDPGIRSAPLTPGCVYRK